MINIQSFTFNPVQENTYVLYNDKDACCIIDPGCYFGNERHTLQEFIEEQKLTPQLLLNTHCHLDHVFGNKYFAEIYRLVLQIHADEQPVLQMAPASGLMFNFPFDNYGGELIFLKEGDELMLDDDKLKVIEAPGHSPGSICFYCEKQKFIIGGDVLFQNSIGRTDLPGGSYETLIKNIKGKLFILPDDTIVYPGHGPATNIGEEKKFNPYIN